MKKDFLTFLLAWDLKADMLITPILNRKIVVLDTDVPYELKNKFFDMEIIHDNRFLWPWKFLYDEALKRGIQLITPDIYFSLPQKPKQAIFISAHMIGNYTRQLLRAGVQPAVIFGYENPFFACRFYLNLKKYARPFNHAYVWKGAERLLPQEVTFHDAAFHPHAYPIRHIADDTFHQRKLLVMINRNNRLHILRKLYVAIFAPFKSLPSLDQRELYLDRLRALDYFASRSAIDLYGSRWDQSVRYSQGIFAKSISHAYRGYSPDKLATLQGYKFSLCFENAIFPGFVTEKIIDSLMAGCIPVYWGAPDINNYIPIGTFIDKRDFKDYNELESYLRAFDEPMYKKYIKNINTFLMSEHHKLFTQEYFADELIEIIESYF